MAEPQIDPLEMIAQAGISDKEKSDVLSQIEQVVTENRIKTSPELFALKHVQSGLLFPALVDGIAIVVVALAVLLLALLFRHGEQQVVGTTGEYASVEGRLIRELQQESQQRLLEKEQQIATVQAQLAQVEKQRAELSAGMDAKIKQREEEYRQRVLQELQVERERLVKQGVASDALASALAAYETERKAYYEQQLLAYRRQLEGERAALDTQLSQLQADYEARIQALRSDRQQLIAQYKQKEDQLQAQLEQRTRVLDVARVEAIQNLAAAQTRIQQLSRQQEQTSAVQDQILGQFEQIRASLGSGKASEALAQITSLRSFLQDDTVASIAEISRQRNMDLFLLDSLENLIKGQTENTRSLSNLSDDLLLLTRLRDLSNQAAQARAQGDTQRADALYNQLLAFMPVVANAHTALLGEARDKALQEAAAKITKDEQARRTQFDALSQQATQSISNGNFDEAFAAYRQALGLDPAVGAAGQEAASELARLGFTLSAYVGQKDANPKALAAIRQAGIDRAAQEAAFVAQTRRVTGNLQQELVNRQEELAAQVRSLEAEKAGLEQRRSEEVAGLNATISSREQEIAGLKTQVASLTEFRNRVSTLQADYRSYTEKEDAALKAGGPNAILDGKLALEGFLATGEMTRLFPDFGRRLRAYDNAFQIAGREAGLLDASEVVQTLSTFQTAAQERAYLDAQIARATNDQNLKDFLTALRGFVR